jgi:hypothetical protein
MKSKELKQRLRDNSSDIPAMEAADYIERLESTLKRIAQHEATWTNDEWSDAVAYTLVKEMAKETLAEMN